MGLRVIIVVLLACAALYAVAFAYGARRWHASTEELRARLDSTRSPARQGRVDFRELEGLPDPVQRYFRTVPTPWRGRFWNYEERDGMRVPLDGEVAWLLPEGDKSYWRGHITDLEYAFAP
jgi:hypothetical protein